MIINVFDYLIIALIMVFIYRLIRKTEAFKIMLGLLVIFLIYLVTQWVGFTQTGLLFKKIMEVTMFGIVVIFAPELRMMLRKIGGITNAPFHQKMELITTIQETVFELSEKKVGALIILDTEKQLINQAENMIKLDALCTKELLHTIFKPNSALHDGAVVIYEDRIAYAGCKLPISGKKHDDLGNLGTRHIAAKENAERFDVKAIVVSEEDGRISIATNKGLFGVKTEKVFYKFFEDRKRKKEILSKLIKKN